MSTVQTLQQQLAGESKLIPSGETVGMANSAKAAMREELYRLQILESELNERHEARFSAACGFAILA